MSTTNFTPTFEQAQAVAETIRVKYPELAARVNGRLEAATVISSTPGAVEFREFHPWRVASQSNPAGSYDVDLDAHSCTCPDHGRNNTFGIVCKHRLATHIYKTLWEPWLSAELQKPHPVHVGDVGVVAYNHPFLGRMNIHVQVVSIWQPPSARGEDRLEVEALPTNGHSDIFDYRYPFADGLFQVATARVRPNQFRPTAA